MTAMYLVGLAVVVAAGAGHWLPRAGWVYRAPRLGLAAWYVVLAVVVVSLSGAAVSLVVHWPVAWDTVCAWWLWSYEALTGVFGTVAQVAGMAAVVLLAGFAGRVTLAVARTARAARRARRDQGALLRLVGRWDPRLQAMVVEHPAPAAYFMPGPRGAVVVTTGAVAALLPAQLEAVLAHERAHASGRHHLLVRGVWLLARALPAADVFGQAAAQVERLLEMRADEVAACRHNRAELARALVTCAEANAAPRPAGAVAATGGDALERVHRLLHPPTPLSGTAQAAVATGLGALAAAPVLLVGLVAAFPALATCLPLT